MKDSLAAYDRVSSYLNGVSGIAPSPALVARRPREELQAGCVASEVRVARLDDRIRERVAWSASLMDLAEEGMSSGLVENIVVHGSWGDLCANSYSDLDLTLVLPRDRIRDSVWVESLRQWVRRRVFPLLYSVDPTQHHGPFFLWPELAEAYDERILPSCVYARSWGVREQVLAFRSDAMHAVRDPSEALSVRALERLAEARSRFFNSGYNVYTVKRYLSNLMLVPALYFADTGQPLHKADSFEPFYSEFEGLGDCIRVASDLRYEWESLLGPAWPAFSRLVRMLPPTSMRRALFFWRPSTLRGRIQREIEPKIPALLTEIRTRLAS